jgi:hypothetical protein
MSTRSNIYLKLKDESKGQTIQFDFSKLPTAHGEQHAELKFPIKDVTIPQDAEYIGVYHHWDGYITGVGQTLLESYTDYDTILNMLIMGDISTINGGVTSYQGWRNEDCPARIITPKTKVSHWVSYKIPRLKRVVTDMFGRVLEGKVVPDPLFEKSEFIKVYGHYVKRAIMKKGVLDSKNALREEYAYLFDGEKWWVAYNRYNEKTDKYVHSGWLDLESELKREKSEIEERMKARTNA